MNKHPANRLERLKIKLKKDEKRQKAKDRAASLWRAAKERDKEKETVYELKESLG